MLVLGASGFIGNAVFQQAKQGGIDVFGTSRAVTDQLIQCAVAEPGELEQLIDETSPDVVVNAVGAGVTPNTSTIEEMKSANLDLVAKLLALASDASQRGFRLIHLASSRNKAAAHRLDDYIATKESATNLVLSALTGGLSGCCLEIFNAYGPGQPSGRLVELVVRSALDSEPITLRTPDQIRDFIHVADVARAVLLAAKSTKSPETAIEIGTGVGTTVRDLAHVAYSLAGADTALVTCVSETSSAVSEVANTQAARDFFDWQSDIDLAAGLSRLIRGEEV